MMDTKNFFGIKKVMCDCRVCKLAVLYPADIDKVIQDVFEHMMESK